jgi:TetR/AcrR family transcriptional regulator, cholesterol catabolism regulator
MSVKPMSAVHVTHLKSIQIVPDGAAGVEWGTGALREREGDTLTRSLVVRGSPCYRQLDFNSGRSALPQPRQNSRGDGRSAPSARSKRALILEVATEQFGREGYEHSKWADVAKAVGIGSTALYHYFESKLHCLYEIMAEALQDELEKFERITKEHDDFTEGLVAVLESVFDLTEHEVLRNRLLVSEQVLVGVHRTSAREEEARQLARARTRDLEFAWATFLTRGMEQGAIPEADARLLTRAILGLYNSVFHWYRPRGTLALSDVADFYVPRCLAVAGLPMDAAGGAAATGGQAPRKASRSSAPSARRARA